MQLGPLQHLQDATPLGTGTRGNSASLVPEGGQDVLEMGGNGCASMENVDGDIPSSPTGINTKRMMSRISNGGIRYLAAAVAKEMLLRQQDGPEGEVAAASMAQVRRGGELMGDEKT